MRKNIRDIIFNILFEVEIKGAYSNISINRNISDDFSYRDESFIREVVYGVIENKLYLDYVIQKFSKVKFNKINEKVKIILRMGIYQIIFMNKVPDSAACNESVKLAKKISHFGVVGFINGLLRNISRNKNNITLPNKKENHVKYLSIKYSHPEWMVKRWIRQFGFEFTESLCAKNNERPKLVIRVNTLKLSRNELINILKEKGYDVLESKISNFGIIINNPVKITELEEYKKGFFTIQDESSMLVAEILNPKPSSLVIDLCSAPGGKATHIAQLMNNKGSVISRDIHKHKLKLIEQNSKRLDIRIIKTEMYDALKVDDNFVNKADYCLVDAPCSGLGIIRRKPDIKWNKTEEDIKEIKKIQLKILENASKYLKENGTLVYSTCTIDKEENVDVINEFLARNKNFKLIPIKSNENNFINKFENDGYMELFPNIFDTDGFFIAKLIKSNIIENGK